MSAGMLRSWYLSKISKSTTPIEYFIALQNYTFYEMNVFGFNMKEYFQRSL